MKEEIPKETLYRNGKIIFWICFIPALVVFSIAFVAIQSGEVCFFQRYCSPYRIEEEPLGFWLIVGFFGFISVFMMGVAIYLRQNLNNPIVIEIVKSFSKMWMKKHKNK